MSDGNVPTCGVMIDKEAKALCPSPATQLLSITDPDRSHLVTGVVLLCDVHDKVLESGKPLLLLAETGEMFLVQLSKEDESHDATQTTTIQG